MRRRPGAPRIGGRFIVLEGPDKSGKSTQAQKLVRELMRRGLRVVHTREPGGTAFAESVRAILLDPEHKVLPLAELLLYEAARVQHTEQVIRPALEDGLVVLSERYTLATTAYQGYARGLPLKLVKQLNHIATGGLTPHLTVILDIPDSQFKVRDPRRAPDRLEKESGAFRRKVQAAYRRLAKTEPRTVLVDAHRGQDDVHRDVLRHVERVLRAA